MSRAVWRLLPVLGAALLVACVSSQQDTGSRQVDNKEAARTRVQLGVAYMQQGNLALAKENLDVAERHDPGSFEVHWAKAQLSERLNLPKDAERHYQAAMRLRPDNPEIQNTYAVFLCQQGEVDRALPLFDRVMENRLYRTPWAVATNAAVCLRADKRHADAVPYLQRAVAMRPDFTEAVVELADAQLALAKPDEAQTVVDSFLAIGFKSPDVLVLGVRAALARGNRAAADNYARLLRRDFPNSAQASLLPQLLSAGSQPVAP